MQYEKELIPIAQSRFILNEKLEKVKDIYDIVLIDTPPSLNLYASIALITADYLIIPSDLKPFANQGLTNVKNFIKQNDGSKRFIKKDSIKVLGILACKISTHQNISNIHSLNKDKSFLNVTVFLLWRI